MSTYKTLVFGDNARDKIAAGVNTLASAVKVTMGPSGQNVVIERPGQPPHLTKDGVTVAQNINFLGLMSINQLQNIGSKLLIDASQRANEESGDGTTSCIVLAHSILANGQKLIMQSPGPNGM